MGCGSSLANVINTENTAGAQEKLKGDLES